MSKRLNPNIAKIHRSYTVGEAAEAYKVHKKTVRNWIRNGLPVIDEMRPLLILGTDLRWFLQQQRDGKKHQCKEGEVYCLKCRAPRKPKPETAKFVQPENGTGRMFARCSECDSKVNRFFSWRQLEAIQQEFKVERAESTKTHNCEGLPSPKLSLA
ncbi:helix-turn-helix domain-containing protein [Vibrio fluvialis]|nr:helix-turn-helix domain-containing protein [Vibrio fluvialis]ELF6482544.1 helix-turn-helix domain-containing protein [Vibrio fluvialis]ELG4656162.1 helix-turn-helix domain-containing protein [Vibrio fluvialis]